jgi:hypothetical protein
MAVQVPIDQSSWSRSSQRSTAGHYDERASHYEGIAYRCRACSKPCVFSPEQQKYAYEVRKKFIWWIPSLCAGCSEDLAGLTARDRELQTLWNESRDRLAGDRGFLEEWLAVVQDRARYGKHNSSLETMLLRLLRECPEKALGSAV